MDRLGDLRPAGEAHVGEKTTLVPADVKIDIKGGADGKPAFMEKFFTRVSTVKNQMSTLRGNIKELEDMHAASLADVKNKAEAKAHEGRVDKKTDDTQELCKSIAAELGAMKKENEAYAASPEHTPSEVQIRNNMHTTLTRKFTEDVQKFQDVQATYKSKVKETVERQVKIVKPGASEEEVRQVMDGEVDIFQQAIVKSGPQHAAARAALENIKDKHNDIVKLEKSIVELQQLFNDMAVLVEQQGEMLDQIEFTVNSTLAHVEKGVDSLKKANKEQKRSRRKMCCIIIILLVIGLAITVPSIMVTQRKRAAAENTTTR